MRRRSGVDTYVLSVDIIKAFDKVDRRLLMAILTKLGVPESLTGCIRRLFDNRKLMFSYNGKDAPDIRSIAERPRWPTRTDTIQVLQACCDNGHAQEEG